MLALYGTQEKVDEVRAAHAQKAESDDSRE
jgi:hypothetical protein